MPMVGFFSSKIALVRFDDYLLLKRIFHLFLVSLFFALSADSSWRRSGERDDENRNTWNSLSTSRVCVCVTKLFFFSWPIGNRHEKEKLESSKQVRNQAWIILENNCAIFTRDTSARMCFSSLLQTPARCLNHCLLLSLPSWKRECFHIARRWRNHTDVIDQPVNQKSREKVREFTWYFQLMTQLRTFYCRFIEAFRLFFKPEIKSTVKSLSSANRMHK